MKAQDLKSPFSWKERCITIHDRIWYIPNHYEKYEEFTFPGWDQIFSLNNPIKIEYCSGNGAWISSRAQQEPHSNWVAVEMKFERVRKIWSKLKNCNLNNLMIVCGKAQPLTKHYIPDNCVQEVYINFPDPWPKNKHRKNRLVQTEFVNEVHRILQLNGSFILATDDVGYSKIIIDVLKKFKGFNSKFPEPYFVSEWENYGTSYFEDLWREKGKKIHYHHFVKVE